MGPLAHVIFKMIRKEGDYYICEQKTDAASSEALPAPAAQVQQYSMVGSIGDRISMMRERVDLLKKNKPPAKYLGSSLSSAFPSNWLMSDYQLSLQIPQELIKLQERVCVLQQRLSGTQVSYQKIESGGTVVQRVRRLQKKLQEMMKSKSIEIIANNVMQYSANMDEKEENFKVLALYDVFNKTQGMNEELAVLEQYLSRLSQVQRVISSAAPLTNIASIHQQILDQRSKLALRIESMFGNMKKQYHQLLAQIDQIQV